MIYNHTHTLLKQNFLPEYILCTLLNLLWNIHPDYTFVSFSLVEIFQANCGCGTKLHQYWEGDEDFQRSWCPHLESHTLECPKDQNTQVLMKSKQSWRVSIPDKDTNHRAFASLNTQWSILWSWWRINLLETPILSNSSKRSEFRKYFVKAQL